MRRRLPVAIVSLVASAIALLPAVASGAATAASATVDPQLPKSDKSYYLAMRDGVRLAINVYFPSNEAAGARFTTILALTRYGRAGVVRDPRVRAQLELGRALVTVDVRGTTSSFGSREGELPVEERADIEEIVAHIVSQPWSNGKVITMGTSYLANTADVATSRPASALLGAIPMMMDFDGFALLYPGGVANKRFITQWGDLTLGMDLGRREDGNGADCRLVRSQCSELYPILQPVDEDKDATELQAALQHRNRWTAQDWLGVSFRDDVDAGGHNIFNASAASRVADLRRERKPEQVWGSWMDADTADAAIARFRTTPDSAVEAWITPNNHHNDVGTDPFRPTERQSRPTAREIVALQDGFIRKLETGTKVDRVIHYYVNGAGVFRETKVWPPLGVELIGYEAALNNQLVQSNAAAGDIVRDMDMSASSGPKSRWTGQSEGIAADYGNRASADSGLILFDTAPMPRDMELAGETVVSLSMSSSSTDPALFVYIEDVAPDGYVAFLTEGQFRAVNRKLADPATLPYEQGPAAHSLLRRDAQPISPGETIRVEFATSSTAAVIRRGHRLRLSIAAADTHMFQRYSNGGPERFTIHVGGASPSHVGFPLRPWQELKSPAVNGQ